MGLQPMINPLMDFTIQGVSTAELTTFDGVVFIAVVHYAHRGNKFEATLQFQTNEGVLQVATQGERINVPVAPFLGSLLAKINGGAHVAQTH